MIKYGIKPYISEKNTRVVSVQYEFNFYTKQPLWKNIKSVKKYQEIKKRSNEYKNKIIIDHEFSFRYVSESIWSCRFDIQCQFNPYQATKSG